MATKTRKETDSDISREMFMALQTPQKNVIRSTLLECLASEREASVRNKLGDAVAEIARQYTAEGKKSRS